MRFLNPEHAAWAVCAVAAAMASSRVFRRLGGTVPYFPGAAWLAPYSGWGRHLPALSDALMWGGLALLAVGLCTPVVRQTREEATAAGIDVALLLDVSTSMSARDFEPVNRLEAAKSVTRDFILKRSQDRLALVAFAAEAHVQCPLTTDHYTLGSILDSVEIAPFASDGTAIGMALVSGVNRLRGSDSKSRAIVLLTDGVNNRGEIGPERAAELCRSYGIRVYAIGLGTGRETEVVARAPDGTSVFVRAKVEIDPAALGRIAATTGGRYFAAADAVGLANVYRQIDGMEKTVVEKRAVKVNRDISGLFVSVAAALVLLAWLPSVRHPHTLL